MGNKDDSILIVGAGVFGLTTALELKRRGYGKVAVLDRFQPPVPDGSSVDISRIIRVEYADPVYHQMAEDALGGWATEYAAHYHQSGFVMVAGPGAGGYLDKAKEVSRASGKVFREWEDATRMKGEFPDIPSDLRGLKSYFNARGGWADAGSAIRQLSENCSRAGVSFITGDRGTVVSLKRDGKRVTGVNVADGSVHSASKIILATGAWTNRLLPLTHASSASGQAVGFIQLTEEEANRVRKMPVVINLSTGVFVFPPYPGTNVLKVAHHGYGWASSVEVKDDAGKPRVVSAPKLRGSNAETGYLPADADAGLRNGLRQLAPEFGERPWTNRRLCWYSDTPEGDFIADYYSEEQDLFLATGGAGHAFKFLPVLGKHIVDCFENKASKELRHKWRLRKPEKGQSDVKKGDGSRGGPPMRVLNKREQAKL